MTVAHLFTFKHSNVAVMVPSGVAVTSRKNLPDFDVYDFDRKSQNLLSAYVGHAPDFHMLSAHRIASVNHRVVDGLNVTDIEYEPTLKGATREVLVQVGSSFNYIHFFYENIPTDLAKEADDIIASAKRVHRL